ncbi:hypothetical protein [Streptomyces sp. NPDC005336]|uniref:hypothetical protein n=1 Tax=unclassified Streptomyces TaxID=2593676 RepID=UPI0033B22948
MITEALPAPAGVTRADDDELDHVYCCDPDRALCGADLSDVAEIVDDWDNEDVDVCVVCVDLERRGVRCGPTCPKSTNARS